MLFGGDVLQQPGEPSGIFAMDFLLVGQPCLDLDEARNKFVSFRGCPCARQIVVREVEEHGVVGGQGNREVDKEIAALFADDVFMTVNHIDNDV